MCERSSGHYWLEDSIHHSQYDNNSRTRIYCYTFIDKEHTVKAGQCEDYVGEQPTASRSAAEGETYIARTNFQFLLKMFYFACTYNALGYRSLLV